MIYTNAKYQKHEGASGNTGIQVTIDGIASVVPISVGNRHYDEMMELVKEGKLTIGVVD
tara:strand:- start:647 stop:823 length:177 start_codon:yes stop_codon:yes gene_type:complete